MSSTENERYLRKHGAALIEAGYKIIPIKRGQKFPAYDGWEKTDADLDALDEWLTKGITFTDKKGQERTVACAKSGIGILAKHTPGVDLDIVDEEAALYMENWVVENVGFAPVRVGNAPKRLMMFRAETPFRKKASTWIDQDGVQQKLEILGDGQQFVAFHIHPDTNRPYEWLYKDGPHVTAHAELPELTDEDADRIVDEFDRLAEERGWKRKSRSTALARAGKIDDDDPFAEDTHKTDISDEELHAKLLMVPGAEDHDTWFQIGMALFHQFDGGDHGLALWHEWSSTAFNYDSDELDKRWPSFSIEMKGRAPVTARFIIKLAKEAIEVAATETMEELTAELKSAPDMKVLKATAEKVKKSDLDQPSRDVLTGLLRDSFKRINKQPLSIKTARDMVRYENPEVRELPRWLQSYVYISGEDRFYSTKTRCELSQVAFDSTYSRLMLTKKDVLEGRAVPERLPSKFALNVVQIPVVDGRRFFPGEDDVFTMNGVRYVNIFNDRNVPEVPETPSKKDRRNVQRVIDHFEHLFPNERERKLFIDWMAYVVQNPGKRPNWAVMLQGAQGDGKTFFGMLLGAMLGQENLIIVDPKSLEGDFTGWAEGHQVAFIEEVKMHGQNRYDVLNRIKPYVSNPFVPIRRMRMDQYNIANMTAYLLATNFRDALPLDDQDGRYFVLFSRFQFKAAIDKFKEENPDYYDELYQTFEESPGAIRGWFLERSFGPEFKPNGRAPDSKAKRYMVMVGKSDEQEAIEELLAEAQHWDISRQLLNATLLLEHLHEKNVVIPAAKVIHRILSDMGFTFLAKIRVDGDYQRFWSQEPDRFFVGERLDTDRVRKWLDDPL